MSLLTKETSQVRILKLNDGEHKDNVVYRLRKGWTVNFVLGPTLTSRVVNIFCNLPNDGEKFERTQYRLLNWQTKHAGSGDKLEYFASVKFNLSGSFQYYFTYDDATAGSGYLIVDPDLFLVDHLLPLDSVCMHTVLSKSLGKFSSWKNILQVSKESGYNVIHFTPIQKLGVSNSSYSIADQHAINPNFEASFADVRQFIKEMCKNWAILSATDVVWNHTAKNSSWLKTSPECAYNLKNSLYFRPSYVLDRALYHLSLDIYGGKYKKIFSGGKIISESDLFNIRSILEENVIPELNLHEFFQVDVKNECARFKERLKSSPTFSPSKKSKIRIQQDKEFHRFGCRVDMDVAVNQFVPSDIASLNIKEALEAFKNTVIWLNKLKSESVEKDMKEVIQNVLSTVAYERLSPDGPKYAEVTPDRPLVTPYFNHPFPNTSVEDEENKIMNHPEHSKMIMAYNGWVMGADALENFAEYPGLVYFRRQLICWGDSIKLRYGDGPQDCPALWKRMKKYTEMMAEMFHGIRIDNCHSTPTHVAEYMLDAARQISPDIYVFAELFTGSEQIDNIFVNRLGLTSLIREALNAWDSHELGRLVYLYGGEPIASFMQPSMQMLKPSRAHALFYDITHDNESMIVKRSVHDIVPSSALVAMSSCAIGSNRGHDEMVPHHIHVVKEARPYREWAQNPNLYEVKYVGHKSGIVRAKRMLNTLHQTMALNGFNQVFVDQRTPDMVAVTRHNSQTHYSYVLVSHTSFQDKFSGGTPHLVIEGMIMGIVLEIKPEQPKLSTQSYINSHQKSIDVINGFEDYDIYMETDLAVGMSACCEISSVNNNTAQNVNFIDFPPGSILVLRIKMLESAEKCVSMVKEIISSLYSDEETEFDRIVAKLDLRALNRVLYRCNDEEMSDGLGIGTYNVSNSEPFTYCGIAGIAVPMAKIRSSNDLGHPICNNLRGGNWLLHYIASRLQKHSETKELGDWYSECFEELGNIPRYLVPTYFELLITATYEKLLKACWSHMSNFVKEGSSFIKLLSLGTVAMCGVVKGANLPLLHNDIEGLFFSEEDPTIQCSSSLAAGLPHFSSGIMRCWGRDTFISMHGLLLVTGRYKDARNLILAFAGCLRHGLIPNLLGEGKICRYNCRDAVWFWLQCIQELCELDGYELLQLPVARIFSSDDTQPSSVGTNTQLLYDVIQEAMQCHADGIHFRERNAGSSIDSNMTNEGFNVEAGVDLSTGFVYGGNRYNCGTWMDKMGESDRAGTRGVPATPRDGSAVELVGLCKSTVSWLQRANNSGKYLYDGVFIHSESNEVTKLTWSEWSKLISTNFERLFYVGDDDTGPLVHKRYIYKDSVGASSPWCDYQLRPNFPIAMVYAPELFDAEHAWKALDIVEMKLLGPLGMKTLDPDDLQYRGDYDNSNDSDDPKVSKGFNYHQGPEWLWPVGYFLRAKLYFARKLGTEKLQATIDFIHSYLVKHQLHLEDSSWCGLPELTNSNGKYCKDSCPIQAWSHATLLDVLFDLTL